MREFWEYTFLSTYWKKNLLNYQLQNSSNKEMRKCQIWTHSFQLVGIRWGHCKIRYYYNGLHTGLSIIHCYPGDTLLIFLNCVNSPTQNEMFLRNVVISKPREWSPISLTFHPDPLCFVLFAYLNLQLQLKQMSMGTVSRTWHHPPLIPGLCPFWEGIVPYHILALPQSPFIVPP